MTPKGKKICIAIGIPITILVMLGVVGSYVYEIPTENKTSKVNKESNTSEIISENPTTNYATTNDLNFTISKIDIHSTNTENRNNAAFFLVFFDIKNIGHEPKKPLYESDFLLKDPMGRSFTPRLHQYTMYSITDDGFLQPGFITSNHATFTISFDPDQVYTLLVNDRTINLGKGRDIGLDLDNAISFAVQNHDISYCYMLTRDYNEIGASKVCLGNYFREVDPYFAPLDKNSISLNMCDSLIQNDRLLCYTFLATKTKDRSICEALPQDIYNDDQKKYCSDFIEKTP